MAQLFKQLKIMKSYLLFILLWVASFQAVAVPSDGVPRSIVQRDSSMLTIRLIGDEHLHYALTMDNLLVLEGIDGGFYYAEIHEGEICPSTILAHDEQERNIKEQVYVRERLHNNLDNNILNILNNDHKNRVTSANERRVKMISQTLGLPTRYIGKRKGLVILVDFPNLQMSSSTVNEDYYKMFNEAGYNVNNHVGSVHDYFLDQSYGKFDLTFDIVGPVTVSRNYGYYGSDSMNGYNDMNVSDMIVEACTLADGYIDYKNYDWNSDGLVDQVFIVYAGYGQATGGASNTIWPHESYLSEILELDGVIISQYACSNELYGYGSEKTLMGIGTACHEFSHCLGLPDLYDTNYSGAFGMSYWGIMNSGSYNGPKGIGEVPCGYTAFERWFAGWLDFTDITCSQKIEGLPCLDGNPIAYRIINDGNSNEFFTIENRQPTKWYKYTAQYEGMHGLLISHIDYDLKAWATNKVNPSPSHQRMSPIVADNSYGVSYENLAGDLFPGIKNVTSLTNVTHVEFGGKLFNKNIDGSYCMNKSILDISEDNGTISFDVIFNNEIPTPVANAASDVTNNSFKANWTKTENADSYELELEIGKSTKPISSEKIMVGNIYHTEYYVDDLDAEFCNYRVRACKENLHTEWSNTIEVLLHDVNGINEMIFDNSLPGSIYTLEGIKCGYPQKGKIYIKNKRKVIIKQ